MGFVRTGNFQVGTYLERENRFVVFVAHQSQKLRCHLPNPGRMVNLLIEGTTQLVFVPVEPGSSRKTDATVIAIKQDSTIINLDTMLFADLLPVLIRDNELPRFAKWKVLEQEKTIGNHRFDFILEIDSEKVITEVKSTTRVVDGIACFPDAVSKRATNHLLSLQELSRQGHNTMILFTVYQKASVFRPCSSIDPTFTKTYYDVLEDIDVLVVLIEGRWIDNSTIVYEVTTELPLE